MARVCALAGITSCYGQISHEHYISRTVLEAIFGSASASVQGVPWSRDSFANVGISSLTAKILCRGHNGILSDLDAEAGRLFRTIQQSQIELRDKAEDTQGFIFSGDLIERWFLKVAFGMWASGNFSNEARRLTGNPPTVWGQLLLATMPWPADWGMYVKMPTGPIVNAHKEFSCQPRMFASGEIKAVDFGLCRLPFTLVMGRPDNKEAWGVHRPACLKLTDDKARRLLELRWSNCEANRFVEFKRIGDPPSRASG